MTDYKESVRLFTEKEDVMLINLRYINGKKPSEIAVLMNRSESQVSNRLDALVTSNDWAKSLHKLQLENKKRAREIRRKKIINMHERGIKNKDIADQLGIARQTVTNEVARWMNEKNLSES